MILLPITEKVISRNGGLFKMSTAAVLNWGSVEGNDNKSNSVISTGLTNNGIFSLDIPDVRILIIVDMKFTAPKIDDTPARCREKIVKSTEAPLWAELLDKGG